MKFMLMNILAALLFAVSTSLAVPVQPFTRDVWVPKILDPTAATIWNVGGTYFVKWALDQKPESVTNPIGTVYLSKDGFLDIGV